jgi:phosphoesterase RecJ-like protein
MSQYLKELIDSHPNITILSHIYPDADALGTSLGIYALLKADGKQVEIVNVSIDLPKHLDFLPNFSKIKHKIDYAQSIIIACDCGSVDRLGFALESRDVINIDHHKTNQNYGILNYVDPSVCASAHVAHRVMKDYYPITPEAATCFYTALLSDTRYFTTPNVDIEVFDFAQQLLQEGADHKTVTYNLTQRRSLASLRILGLALGTVCLHRNATVASMIIDRGMIEATGAKMSDIDGFVDYARSLATVEIGILLVMYEHKIKVSLRSKRCDITALAEYFGGGGHRNACGFVIESTDSEALLDRILKKIETLGWSEC